MRAITRLRHTGLTTAEIADGIKDRSGGHLVRMYERFDRFPSQRTFVCIVELAESRGVKLAARDFLPPMAEVACENASGKASSGKRNKG